MTSSLKIINKPPHKKVDKDTCPLMKILVKYQIDSKCNIRQIRKIHPEPCHNLDECIVYRFVKHANLFHRFKGNDENLRIPEDKMPEIKIELEIFLENQQCYFLDSCAISSSACSFETMKTCEPIFKKQITG